MKTYRNLFAKVCDYDNLYDAFLNASAGKTKKQYVIDFEKSLDNNLYALQWELFTRTYKPHPLTTFTIRDPKTRKISASHFRDRVIHHAICNVIAPIFESRFIFDTFANRKGKGTLAALERFDHFMHKVTGNGKIIQREREREPLPNSIVGFALKADIRHYFENVDQGILISILRRRINDENLMWLIRTILENHKTEIPGKGMPLGNLTSQFFANVYLSELDYFVKHKLRVKYYLRYVDDFIILHRSKEQLENWETQIDAFLRESLKIELHPDKTKIISLGTGVQLLGFRAFYHFRILKKSNVRRVLGRLALFRAKYAAGEMEQSRILLSNSGWQGYAMMGNTFKLRQQVHKEIEGILAQPKLEKMA
ncbi:MAG: reverse transcriptase/maturase family protein [Candidatus Micrarchaeota archaeon]|nr:reverse transcriptase/maturase family protein [Candidatus Micrarchaeota archaeon]